MQDIGVSTFRSVMLFDGVSTFPVTCKILGCQDSILTVSDLSSNDFFL